MNKAFSLLELLCALAIILLLGALMLPVLSSGARQAKGWIYGSYNYHENQIAAFLVDDDTFPQHFWVTNKVRPWFK